MQVLIEVKQAVGEVRSGISQRTNKPYKMAEQEVAVFVPGADFPVVGRRDVFVPRNPDGTFGEPEWMKVGRYQVPVLIRPDRYGRLESSLDFRNAKAVAAAPTAKAA